MHVKVKSSGRDDATLCEAKFNYVNHSGSLQRYAYSDGHAEKVPLLSLAGLQMSS